MIILFVLLPALALGAEIDWIECGGNENTCYCMSQPLQLHSYTYGTDPDGIKHCADVGIQTIYFTDEVALILMQVRGAHSRVLGDSPRLTTIIDEGQGVEKELFGCKMNNGKPELDTIDDDNRIELYEDLTHFEAENVVCAVKIKRANDILEKIINLLTSKITFMKLQAPSAPAEGYKFMYQDPLFFKQSKIKCDPFSLQELTDSPDFQVRPLKNKLKKVLNCKNYGDSYTMRYQSEDNDSEMDNLECSLEQSSEYVYKIVKKDSNGNAITEKVTDPRLYWFYCAARMEELCEYSLDCAQTDPKCPIYTKGRKGFKAKLECPGNKWMINDEYQIMEAICKKDEIRNANEAAFYPSAGKDEPIAISALCFESFNATNEIMQCADENFQLTIVHAETGVTLNTSNSYTCDPTDGQWKHDREIVPAYSGVKCVGMSDPGPKETLEYSDQQIALVIAGTVLIIIVIGVGCSVASVCCWKHRQELKMKMKIDLHKKAKAEIIEDCREDFSQFLQATPSSAGLVLEGFKKIEMLLREEVDYPDAWEEAYKFLLRFHGSIRMVDRPIWHMFTRYLYLEAKKIIDKHDWSTPAPIRIGNQSGLIRAVAVNLLSFSFNDLADVDSEKLILAGFRALGFHSQSQYPHAGLMWALVYHTRPPPSRRKAKPTEREYFDRVHFEHTLRMIVQGKHEVHVPSAELIPSFGSVAQQAAFALGALPDCYYVKQHSFEIMFRTKEGENGAVSKSYFEGILQSVNRSPIEAVIEGCGMRNGPNPRCLEELAKVAPVAEWNRLVDGGTRLLTYYGRHMDARRLHERFMPDDKDTDFFKMQLDQKLFEEAIEKDKEDIRAWFAARTDRDEFKKKPAAFINPKPAPAFVPPTKNAGSGSDHAAAQ